MAPSICAVKLFCVGNWTGDCRVALLIGRAPSNGGSVPFSQLGAGFALYLDLQGSKGSYPADSI